MAWKYPVYNWLLSVCREAARVATYAVAESAKCFSDFAKDEANVARFNAAMSVVLPKVVAAMAKTTAGALASMTPLATAIATAAIETAYQSYKAALASVPPIPQAEKSVTYIQAPDFTPSPPQIIYIEKPPIPIRVEPATAVFYGGPHTTIDTRSETYFDNVLHGGNPLPPETVVEVNDMAPVEGFEQAEPGNS